MRSAKRRMFATVAARTRARCRWSDIHRCSARWSQKREAAETATPRASENFLKGPTLVGPTKRLSGNFLKGPTLVGPTKRASGNLLKGPTLVGPVLDGRPTKAFGQALLALLPGPSQA